MAKIDDNNEITALHVGDTELIYTIFHSNEVYEKTVVA